MNSAAVKMIAVASASGSIAKVPNTNMMFIVPIIDRKMMVPGLLSDDQNIAPPRDQQDHGQKGQHRDYVAPECDVGDADGVR